MADGLKKNSNSLTDSNGAYDKAEIQRLPLYTKQRSSYEHYFRQDEIKILSKLF